MVKNTRETVKSFLLLFFSQRSEGLLAAPYCIFYTTMRSRKFAREGLHEARITVEPNREIRGARDPGPCWKPWHGRWGHGQCANARRRRSDGSLFSGCRLVPGLVLCGLDLLPRGGTPEVETAGAVADGQPLAVRGEGHESETALAWQGDQLTPGGCVPDLGGFAGRGGNQAAAIMRERYGTCPMPVQSCLPMWPSLSDMPRDFRETSADPCLLL